jgi:hypothetical protein
MEALIEELVVEASEKALDHPEAFVIMATPIREAIYKALAAANQGGWEWTSTLQP